MRRSREIAWDWNSVSVKFTLFDVPKRGSIGRGAIGIDVKVIMLWESFEVALMYHYRKWVRVEFNALGISILVDWWTSPMKRREILLLALPIYTSNLCILRLPRSSFQWFRNEINIPIDVIRPAFIQQSRGAAVSWCCILFERWRREKERQRDQIKLDREKRSRRSTRRYTRLGKLFGQITNLIDFISFLHLRQKKQCHYLRF